MTKFRKMVFVINNYTPEDVERVKNMDAKAVRAGLEIGKQEHTPHIQGAVVWNHAKTYKAAQKALCGKGRGCFTQKMQGDWDAQKYCLKDGEVIRDDPYEECQGRRSDIIALRDSIKRGATDAELCMEHPEQVAKYQRFIGFARNAFEPVPEALPQGSKQMGIWVWSEAPNMGKTTWMTTNFPDAYEKASDRWWDGYQDEDEVFVDEPNPVWFASFWNNLKIWCQEKPFRGQRGVGMGKRIIRFKRMFVFANQSPEEYFTSKDASKSVWDEAIFRSRFKILKIGAFIGNASKDDVMNKAN